MNSEWDDSPDGTATTNLTPSAIGLLTIYEYRMSYKNATASTGYLNNGLSWDTMSSYSTMAGGQLTKNNQLYYVNSDDSTSDYTRMLNGKRPAINLKPNIEIVAGSGTSDDPYQLKGDNDKHINSLLSTRYSG